MILGSGRVGTIVHVVAQERPEHAGICVGQRHRDQIPRLLLPQGSDPPPEGVRAAWRPAEDALRAADKSPPEIRVPALADAELLGVTPAGMLAWYQPHKGGEVAAIF